MSPVKGHFTSPYRSARPQRVRAIPATSHEDAAIAALVLACLMVVFALLSSGEAGAGISRLFME
jgi:hypothetical protein